MLQRRLRSIFDVRHCIGTTFRLCVPWVTKAQHSSRLDSLAFSPLASTLASSFFRSRFSTYQSLRLTEDLQRELRTSVSQLDSLVNQLNDASSMSSSKRQTLQRTISRIQDTSVLLEEYDHLRSEIEDYKVLAADDEDPELVRSAKLEIDELVQRRTSAEERLLLALLPHDDADDRDILLEVRAAAGGQEASHFAQELFRMYKAFAGGQGWKFEDVTSATNLVAVISGQSVYQHLKYEIGVHRIQRVPATETKGRVHTSTASVVVMPQVDAAAAEINQADLKVETMRASGAGGQHVNTTDSAVRITHMPSGIVVSSSNQRSQYQNKAEAMRQLASRIADAERQRQQACQTAERRALLGTGDRSERIRTYNFQENRITDHRIGYTVHGIEAIMAGTKLGELISKLRERDQQDRLMEVLVTA